MELVYISLTAVISVMILVLGIRVYSADKTNVINKSFTFFALITLIWVIFDFSVYQNSLAAYQTYLNRLNLAAICFLVLSLSFFVTAFPKEYPKIGTWLKYIAVILTITLSLYILFTKGIIDHAFMEDYGSNFEQGKYFLIFVFFVSLLALYPATILIIKYIKSDENDRHQLKYIFYGIAFLTVFNLIFNLFIPMLTGNFRYARLGTYSSIFFVGFTAYAILKAHIFNLRIILTETAVVIINVINIVQVFISKSWTETILRVVFTIIVLYGSNLLLQSVKREIKQREQLQKLTAELEDANKHLKELDMMKTEFISIASHELLTPISAILGYLSMILDEKIVPVDNPKTKKFLQNIYASARRLSKLVEDLLNVSRIEQGRIVMDRQSVDATRAAKEVIAEVMPKAKQANLTLTLEEPVETIPKVYADFDKVKEILVNIVGNAIKFTKKGGITVSLKTSRDEEVQGKRGPGNYIVISVKDTGVGIPKEEQDNIFKKFSRAGRWATRDVQGTGLGLYISKSLTEMMGGKIWVASDAGKGATFSISLSEVRPQDKRMISGDVAKLGEPEQKQLVDKGEVEHAQLKPIENPDDTSDRMHEVLKSVSSKELKCIKNMEIDK